ncbi:glycosyltransferase [Kineosporia sp. NBRC 101731]|uniref:glycosyltransferase n=1 Tax=Kineosporia sp. NBRC 101731 TaxID=3032199 RepID=UPI0025552469|nr:glycosyltransferase [Kineosporia sp. NBRC 101731]
MTYTASGRAHLISAGVPATQVTAVGNSTDTAVLQERLHQRRLRDLSVSETFGLKISGRTVAMYAGGLDGDKRVPFLTEASAAAHRLDERFLLLVAGSGEEESLLKPGIAAGYISHMRRADATELADMAAVSKALWMPGRVGLVAVDAMALQIPVFSTPFPHHAPEYDFLTPGTDLQILTDSPDSFAEEALSHMANGPGLLHRRSSQPVPNINDVVSNMMTVIDLTISRM